MDPNSFEDILRKLQDKFLDLYRSLPQEIRRKVREQFRGLMAALFAARNAVGAGGQADALRGILEALKRFLAAMIKAGWSEPQAQFWIRWVEHQLARIGAGAGLTAGAALLVLLAILAWTWSIHEMVEAKGLAPTPVGGPSCGSTKPVATGLTASSWSIWGESRAFRNAQTAARAAAQEFPCPDAACASGVCRGNCAILDVEYKWWVFTKCMVTYDVYCECY
jgi:hypothetical protein